MGHRAGLAAGGPSELTWEWAEVHEVDETVAIRVGVSQVSMGPGGGGRTCQGGPLVTV